MKLNIDTEFISKNRMDLLFTLISNALIPSKKPFGSILVQKTSDNFNRLKKEVEKYKK
jgi:hypothetical protein